MTKSQKKSPREPPTPKEMIESLARECAHSGLKIKDAVTLFDSVYLANALALTHGNKTKAAEIAGIKRESIIRKFRELKFDMKEETK